MRKKLYGYDMVNMQFSYKMLLYGARRTLSRAYAYSKRSRNIYRVYLALGNK